MKIGLVTHRLGYQGGAELFVRDLALGLARRGHTTRLLHGDDAGRDAADYARAFTETRAKTAADALRGLDAAYVMKALDDTALAFLGDLPVVVGAHDHDQTCIRAHRYLPFGNEPCHRTPGVSCWLHGCGLVRDRSGESPLGVTLADPFARRRKLRALAARASLAACSHYVANQLLRAGAPASRVSVVHPIPPPSDAPRVARPNARRLLAVGQLVHGKGLDLAVRALARLPADVTLDVVGEGPSRDAPRRPRGRAGPRARAFRGVRAAGPDGPTTTTRRAPWWCLRAGPNLSAWWASRRSVAAAP
jgi:glycosyltransferase involved in cell wall biosynthesis